MKHVIVTNDGRGNWCDPRAYLSILPEIAESLPRGARAYAQDPGHYDFYGSRCVKDLRFTSLEVDDETGTAVLRLAPNELKHDVGLALTYIGVTSLSFNRPLIRDWAGTITLDEVLPVQEGVSHEILFTGGTLVVIVAADLEARWE